MKLSNLWQRLPKRLLTGIAVATAVALPLAANAWGPDRPTYTIEKPADNITFNSITNNPNLGDERNFVTIREKGTTGTWKDSVEVQAGKEYEVSVYVHNNAGANLNLVAEQVKAKVNLPTNTAKSIEVQGFISASNATPKEVYDHATFTSKTDFNLAYVEGSARYHNNVFGKYGEGAGTPLPESIFTSAGATLGYDKLDGKIPGCFQYAGVVVFTVKPQVAQLASDFTVSKQVRKAGTATWMETVNVAAGDKLNYRIVYTNAGAAEAKNVKMQDVLPKNISLAPGSVKILNANNPNGAFVKDGDKLVNDGINIGSYSSGTNAIVAFDATVGQADKLDCGINTLRNIASVTPEGQTTKEDDATVTVTKECKEQPKETPMSVCEIKSRQIVTINKSQFDTRLHSTNAADCDKPATPSAPVTELPQTGLGDTIATVLGLGAITTAAGYYVASRRQ